jgi:hypothetical protein
MQWKSASFIGVISMLSGIEPVPVYAKQYLSVEEAQRIFFSGEILQKVHVVIPKNIHELLRKESGIRHPFNEKGLWKSSQGSWFIVDEVVGKHEMISYAVGIDPKGIIKGIEILQYNESYGGQIREKKWLQQFEGKTINEPIQLNTDIFNITGATLSAKHVTDGVRRVMILYREFLSRGEE